MEFDKVTYGKLFYMLAEQEQAMSTGKLYIAQGALADYGAVLILYPKSRPRDPPEPEPSP